MKVKMLLWFISSLSLGISWSFLTNNPVSAEIRDINQDARYEVVASNPHEGVTFSCKQAVDPANGETIPATVAMVPQRQETINLILWKSEHFGAWQPQSRCETVSPKFQTFYQDGRLRYLTHGEINGYPVICAVMSEDESCTGENQLFQVKPNGDPQLVLRQLMDVVEGKVDEGVIYQGTDGAEQLYISVDEFLEE